jgi:hypothetical protein
MRHASVLFVAAMLLVGHAGRAQQIPVTVAAAEAEAASFPHDPTPVVLPAAYVSRTFDGSVERRCVQPVTATSLPASLRSGEMILRGYAGPRAGQRGNKMLWMPLHDPGRNPTTLIIRGARFDHPSDTLRQMITTERGPARQVGHPNSFGFPSTVIFPTSGRWLVVANDNHDWGCFILDVADPVKDASH